MKRTVYLLVLLCFAMTARAGDGVREINQACALAGCFAGDAAGFPVSISTPGSYRLTSDLVVAVDQRAISASAASKPIHLDLGGFAISGPATCTGEPAACTGTGAGTADGVSAGGGNATIRNGTVRGFGNAGVVAGAGSTLEDMVLEQNGDDGFRGSGGGSRRITVRGCRIRQNGNDGMSLAWQDGDGDYGGNLVEDNIVAGNGGDGIRIAGGVVRRNVLISNGGFGIASFSAPETGYADNLLLYNNGGNAQPQVSSDGTQLGTNVCGTDTTCP